MPPVASSFSIGRDLARRRQLFAVMLARAKHEATNKVPIPGISLVGRFFSYTRYLVMPFSSLKFVPYRINQTAPVLRASFRLLILSLSVALLAASPSIGQPRPTTESFDSLAKKAAEARDGDRLDEAVSLYKKALAMRPKWAEGWWSLGMLEYDSSNYGVAARAFRQFLPLAPKDGTANVMLGLCEFEMGEDAAALRHLEKGKELGIATNPQLRLVLLYHDGVLLLRAGQFKSAQTNLIGLCTQNMQGEDALQYLGLAFLRVAPKDMPSRATPGGQIVIRVGRAACLTGQKKYDEARQEYSALTQEYPEYPNIHYAYGRFLLDVNDAPGGIEEFKLELRNHPNDVNSRLEIAAAEYKLDSAAGLPYAEEAVKLNPRMPFAHYLLGLLYLDTDEYLKAIPELQIAEKSFPKDARVYFALGSAYSRAGRKQDAERARTKFQQLSEESPEESKASY
jgi:tetratricopeptide (TPR) repeat protein